MGFSTIPVVNMAGRIIGMIPRNFVIVLIEQHAWYEEAQAVKRNGSVHTYYRTSSERRESLRRIKLSIDEFDQK